MPGLRRNQRQNRSFEVNNMCVEYVHGLGAGRRLLSRPNSGRTIVVAMGMGDKPAGLREVCKEDSAWHSERLNTGGIWRQGRGRRQGRLHFSGSVSEMRVALHRKLELPGGRAGLGREIKLSSLPLNKKWQRNTQVQLVSGHKPTQVRGCCHTDRNCDHRRGKVWSERRSMIQGRALRSLLFKSISGGRHLR